jgi:hypothetical protein
MPRFRPRISIITALLLMTIAGMAIVIVQLWTEVGPLRADVRRLRNEVGEITIEEPAKLHAVQVRTNDKLAWKWRFFIPENVDASLKFSWGAIPQMRFPKPDVIKKQLESGEHWVTIAVRRNEAGDGWECFLECSRASDTTLPIPEEHQWFLRPQGGFSAAGVGTFTKMDDDDDGATTFVLQRYRVEPPRSEVRAYDDPSELPGFIIWLERQ